MRPLTVAVGRIQDVDDLWMVSVDPNINDTPFYVRRFRKPATVSLEIAHVVTECLRTTDGITELLWHTGPEFESRDFSVGSRSPVVCRVYHSRSSNFGR
jgi:hypothetical protein